MSGTNLDEYFGKTIVKPAKPKLSEPRKYKVIMINDDYTPMDFVVLILQKLFRLDEPSAMTIMLQIHHQGKGVCGVFTRDIAETKVTQVNAFAKEHHHPLLCIMEPE